MDQDQRRRITHRNLSYQLAEAIGRGILSGQTAPNAILPGEVELGDMYGVSRTAVREAIKMLAAKGMVLPRPRIGTRVLPKQNWNYLDQDLLAWLDFADHAYLVDEYKVVRRTLEPEAAAQAALNATDEEREELQSLMTEMLALTEEFDHERWIRIDTRFHQVIYFASSNHFISPFGNLFKSVFDNYFRIVTKDRRSIKIEVHQRIVEGILQRNPDMARQAVIELLS